MWSGFANNAQARTSPECAGPWARFGRHKLIAGREEGYAFAAALIEEGVVSRETVDDRHAILDDVDD